MIDPAEGSAAVPQDPAIAYAFDAYGTLFDVNAAIMRHAGAIGPEAPAMAALWRVKQLEYSWTRTLMGRYADFWQLTEQALDFVLARHAAARPLRQHLLDAYWQLDAYADVAPLLRSLKAAGRRAVIFTNGTVAMAEAAMRSAGLDALIEGIVSVDAIRRFKTAPETYQLVCDRLGLPPGEVALVSSNRWDIAGATAFGLQTIWCNRAGMPDEYPEMAPGRVIAGLSELMPAA
jgi:2-haloacid dehalogenase